MILQIESRQLAPGVGAVQMSGRICLGRECLQVESTVNDLIKADVKKVVFDLDGVTLVDSTGVGIIVTCFGRLKRAGGELRLAGVKGNVKDLLTMTQLDQIMRFYPTVEAAKENF
jgi:anti-anti-sigma factor